MEVRREVDEKVSKNGVKQKKEGIMGIKARGCMLLPLA